MKKTYAQTIALLRSGLSGEAPALPLFEGDVDWREIYSLSASQTIVSIVTDGISNIPDHLKPRIEDLEPFLADTLAVEMRNGQMDRFLVNIMDNLENRGFTPVLLKGQGLAVNYPVPSHRQCGDIDLLAPVSEYREQVGLLAAKAGRVDGEYSEILHQGMMFGNIEVEVHGSIRTIFSPSLDRKLDAALERLFRDRDFSEVTIEGRGIRVPGDVFNAVYIFLHMFRHYFSGGVGLRQITDWARFIHSKRNSLDREKLKAVLEDLGLMGAWKVFGAFAVEYLAIPEESVPFYSPCGKRRLERILAFVFKCGNFGANESTVREDEPYFIRKLHSFFLLDVHDKLRHFTEFPLYSLRYFFGAVSYGFGRLFRGR